MADVSWINGRLATGAALSGPADVDEIAAAGVTHVIDCRIEFDDTALLAGRCAVLWIGVPDDGQPKPVDWFAKGIAFALDALSHPHAKVYTHCAAGVNRGPSMTYAILRSLGWTAQFSEATIRAARPQVGLAYRADADRAIVALGFE
jgi:dual specificity phosphatase 3